MYAQQQRTQDEDQLLEQQLQTQQEEQVEDRGAQQQARNAVAQQAGVEQIPAQQASAEQLVTQGAQPAESASEQALGPETSTTDQANEPWTTESIASLVAGNDAGAVIRAISASDTENAIALLKSSGAWDNLLKALPTGDALAAGTKAAMYKMVKDGNTDLADAKKLFEVRFKHPLKDKTGSWTLPNVRIVWHQLDNLPEQDVSDETIFTAFYAIAGGGGFYTWGDIELGADMDAEHMPHTVRHEVGHGVHDALSAQVDPWLQSDMSFWYVGTDDGGLESWITGLGGYPDKYQGPDGKEYPFDDTAKQWIKFMVRSYTGSGSWDPARATPDEGEDEWQQAMWSAMPAAVKNACAQSTSYWYQNWRNFQTGTDGKRYFLNHWYNRAYTIGDVAATAIEATGDDYTAMSEYEFFANCYAEYFEDPAGTQDATKWGGSLPSSVQGYFKTCILERHPYSAYTQSLKTKKT